MVDACMRCLLLCNQAALQTALRNLKFDSGNSSLLFRELGEACTTHRFKLADFPRLARSRLLLSPNQRACLKTSLPHPPRSLEARSSGRSRRAHRKRRPNLPRAWTRPAGVACKFAAPLQGARAFTFAVASCKTSGPRSSSQ